MTTVSASPCFPTQEEIDERMRVLNGAFRQLETTQVGDVKSQAENALKVAYDWLVTRGIDFYFDRETDNFRV